MTKHTTLGLSAILFALAACGSETGSNARQPVPGTRASEGDLCDRENEYGRSCVRDGDRCADGGNAPASFQCVYGTWRCVPDNRVISCRRDQPRPTDPPRMDPPARPQGRVLVTCGGPESSEALTDSNDFSTRVISISVTGRSVEVRRLHGRLGWSTVGLNGHVVGQRGMRYFHDVKVRDRDSGQTLMGPIDVRPTADLQDSDVMLIDAFTVQNGTTRRMSITTDTAENEEQYHDFTFRFYSFRLGVDGEQRIFFADDLRWSDTGESVGRDEVTYDPSCFASPAENDFMVRARFQDLIVGRDYGVTSTTVTSPNRAVALGGHVGNDGHEDGYVEDVTVVGLARVNGDSARQVMISQVVTSCRMLSVDGRVLGGGRIIGNEVRFQSLAYRVSGRGHGAIRMECDFVWPFDTAGSFVEIRFGALYDSFRARTGGGLGRIQGTLDLDQNRLPQITTAMTVTLRPFGS